MTRPAEPYRITTATGPDPARGGAWRGVLAVLALFATAADELATALIGIPPVRWLVGQVTAIIRATYQRAAYRAPDPEPEPGVITGRIAAPIEEGRSDG